MKSFHHGLDPPSLGRELNKVTLTAHGPGGLGKLPSSPRESEASYSPLDTQLHMAVAWPGVESQFIHRCYKTIIKSGLRSVEKSIHWLAGNGQSRMVIYPPTSVCQQYVCVYCSVCEGVVNTMCQKWIMITLNTVFLPCRRNLLFIE